jgi:hypothetical protein
MVVRDKERIMTVASVQEVGRSFASRALKVLLLIGGLSWLIACQGVSTGGSNQQQQQQNGTLSLSSSSLNFGSVTAGTSKTLTVQATNSGTASVVISGASISTKYFSLSAPTLPVTISSGHSTTLSLNFTPNAAGSFSAAVTITSDASNPTTTLGLSGTGVADGQLTSNPSSEGFGTVTVGSKQTLAGSVTNNGGTSVTISQASVTGAGFSMSGLSAPLTLSAGQSANFSVAFAPQTAGAASGSISITSDASNPSLAIALSGTGTTATAQLIVSPTTLNVGNVVAGTSGTASGTLTASGAGVTITAANISNSVFSIGGLSLPATLPAGQSAPFTVTFSPQVAGAASGTLTFASNAQPATTLESLAGTGTPAPTHTVNLSWNASTSPNISGYNVYRTVYAGSCGSFSRINSVLDTGTLYTDSVVADGTSYCYATTAVNTSNQESGYSNIVSNVQIPAP